MNAVLIPLSLTLAAAALAFRSWRCGRRIIALLSAVIAIGTGLVAIRDLPEPVVVALLLAALAAVAVVTAWPWLARARRAGSRTEETR